MASLKECIVIYILLIYAFLYCIIELFIYAPILYLAVFPFSRKQFTKLISFLVLPTHYFYLSIISYLQNVKIKCYMNKETRELIGKESAFIISNHTSELDWLVLYAFVNHYNLIKILKVVLVGHAKKVPIFGQVMVLLSFAFVNRSFKDDQKYLLDKAKQWEEFDRPFMALMFPEGTRLTKEKHAASNKFAVEKGVQPLKYHLLPRTKGFITIFRALRHKFDAIYDFELAYVGSEPTFTSFLTKKPLNVHVYLRRIPVENMPTSEEDLVPYLYKVYQEKDKFAESFNKNGHFLDVAGISEADVIDIKAPKHTFIVMFSIFTLKTLGIMYCLYKLYINKFYIVLSSVVIFFIISYYMILRVLKVMAIQSRTKYGEIDADGSKE